MTNKMYCPDPENTLTFPQRHKFESEHVGQWIAMESNGGWFRYSDEPIPNLKGGGWEGEYCHKLKVSKLPYGHFFPEIWTKTKQQITSAMVKHVSSENCLICDNHGGVHGPCLACGRPAWSKCVLGASKTLSQPPKGHSTNVTRVIEGRFRFFLKAIGRKVPKVELSESIKILQKSASHTKPRCALCNVIEARGRPGTELDYHFTYCTECENIEDLSK